MRFAAPAVSKARRRPDSFEVDGLAKTRLTGGQHHELGAVQVQLGHIGSGDQPVSGRFWQRLARPGGIEARRDQAAPYQKLVGELLGELCVYAHDDDPRPRQVGEVR